MSAGMSQLSTSNLRALLIFASYLSINISLTGVVLYSILVSHNGQLQQSSASRQSRQHLRLIVFSALAALSLTVTWHYMLSFFALSYQSWAFHRDPKISIPSLPPSSVALLNPSTFSDFAASFYLSHWLKETQLFREAWETVVSTPGRFFWSQPIFFITTAWSIFIDQQTRLLKIKHGWAYMILGQLVAISFASNLFYLSVCVESESVGRRGSANNRLGKVNTVVQAGDESSESTKMIAARGNTLGVKTRMQQKYEKLALNDANFEGEHKVLCTPPLILYAFLLFTTIASIAATPSAAGSPHFLLMLAVPHILLLVPPLLPRVLPAILQKRMATKEDFHTFYDLLFKAVLISGLLFQMMTAYDAYTDENPRKFVHPHADAFRYPFDDTQSVSGWRSLLRSLLCHPAVSSVGWDSILCIISFVAWHVLSSD